MRHPVLIREGYRISRDFENTVLVSVGGVLSSDEIDPKV